MKNDKTLGHLLKVAKELATPIDFDELKKRGIISSAGAWYRVPDMKNLPDEVATKISQIASDAKGVKVKFHKPSRSADTLAQRIQKMMEKE
jgi:hypothetical protein